jgi:hypothetical protein
MQTHAGMCRYFKLCALILTFATPVLAIGDPVQVVPGRIRFISFNDVLGVGETIHLSRTSRTLDFVVPAGNELVLTDFVAQPQDAGAQGRFLIQMYDRIPNATRLTTNINLTMDSLDASSFQLHLNSGMVFPAGSRIELILAPGSPTSLNLSAFGYLVRLP